MQQVEKAAAVLGEKMMKKILQKQTAPRIKNPKKTKQIRESMDTANCPQKGLFFPNENPIQRTSKSAAAAALLKPASI